MGEVEKRDSSQLSLSIVLYILYIYLLFLRGKDGFCFGHVANEEKEYGHYEIVSVGVHLDRSFVYAVFDKLVRV